MEHGERMKMHRDIVQKLRAGEDAMDHFRRSIRPVLDLLTQSAKHEPHNAK